MKEVEQLYQVVVNSDRQLADSMTHDGVGLVAGASNQLSIWVFPLQTSLCYLKYI